MIQEYFYIPNAPLFCKYLGVLGFLLYMMVFAGLQFQWIDGNSLAYTFVSVLAASLVLVSLMADFNLASALIQIAWITIGTCGLAFRLMRLRAVKAEASRQNQPAHWQSGKPTR